MSDGQNVSPAVSLVLPLDIDGGIEADVAIRGLKGRKRTALFSVVRAKKKAELTALKYLFNNRKVSASTKIQRKLTDSYIITHLKFFVNIPQAFDFRCHTLTNVQVLSCLRYSFGQYQLFFQFLIHDPR